MLYLALKTVHVIAAVLFLGNIITGVMWKLHADRSGDPRLMAHALAGVIRSDRWFTVPGVVLLVATGVALALIAGYPMLRTPWIVLGIGLLIVSGGAATIWVEPAQRQLLEIAGSAPFDAEAYARVSRRWMWSGALATAAPLLALALMVFKP